MAGSALIFSMKEVGCPGGPSTGFLQHMMETVTAKAKASMIPGITPARNSLPMDCS